MDDADKLARGFGWLMEAERMLGEARRLGADALAAEIEQAIARADDVLRRLWPTE